jgi:hypothetical protein
MSSVFAPFHCKLLGSGIEVDMFAKNGVVTRVDDGSEAAKAGLRVGDVISKASKLYLGDRLVIDNDSTHPMQQLSRWVRVPAGPIPFRLEYADAGGVKGLLFDVGTGFRSEDRVDVQLFVAK